jgi:hypothetical protein
MKKEDHFVQLVMAALLGMATVQFGIKFMSVRSQAPPELLRFLIADALCGLTILPILACLRRGYPSAKIGAVILCILPLIYINYSVKKNGRILIREWKRQ